jgi:hypothetical protein
MVPSSRITEAQQRLSRYAEAASATNHDPLMRPEFAGPRGHHSDGNMTKPHGGAPEP